MSETWNIGYLPGALAPEDVASWLRVHGWEQLGLLPNIASLWQRGTEEVMLPLTPRASDFSLRWTELLDTLSKAMERHPYSILLEISNEGSDVAEWRATGEVSIDYTIPLPDGEALVSSVHQAIVASANATLQRRGYFGHSIPKAAREHGRTVRMGQTRAGSYIIPVISRIPDLNTLNEDELALIAAGDEPFERRAMRQLSVSLEAIQTMAVEQEREPTMRQLNESVVHGVSHELCAAIAKALHTESIGAIDVGFS